MKNVARLLLAVGLMAAPFTGPAEANSCQARAAALASARNATVLSARQRGNECLIKLLIASNGGPPKRITVVERM